MLGVATPHILKFLEIKDGVSPLASPTSPKCPEVEALCPPARLASSSLEPSLEQDGRRGKSWGGGAERQPGRCFKEPEGFPLPSVLVETFLF